MKKINLLCSGLLLLFACSKSEQEVEHALPVPDQELAVANVAAANTPVWRMVFSDEFNSTGAFDSSKWMYCVRQTSAWNKYLTASADYVNQDGSNLVLRMDNAVIAGDNVPYHSGGVQSSTKFSLRYGKVEVRAKFKRGQGSWPAIWMMPEVPVAYGGWPNSGEIDIMEHVNYATVVHNTIHNSAVTNAAGSSTATRAAAYNVDEFNTYGIIWTPTAIQFYVNNVLQYTYSKQAGATPAEWPFDKPFYLILNQSGGAGWPGPITNADLPFDMQVDWVRIYKQEELSNPGLESATVAPWNAGPTTTLVSNNARSGTKAILQQGGTTTLEQTVTGLLPNTTYTFGGYGKVATTGASAFIGVKNFGGSSIGASITNTTYQHASVTFTTGASNTSATVYYYKPNSGTVYGDDFYLNKQ
jgi:beta-glucanase (GH16 family)